MNMKKVVSLLAAAAMSATMLAGTAMAADFPDGKAITIVCPYAAGGASDMTSRIFAEQFQEALGTTVMVENTTGAGGAVGLEKVRGSKADGYTIAYMPVESTMMAALGNTDLTTEDFRFIGRAMTIPAAITVKADSGMETFEDFINYAKENPGKVRVGNSGTGSIWHVAAASVEQACDIELAHMPFADGAAAAVTALLGGNIEAVAVSPSEVYTLVESGDLKTLVVLGEARSSVLPEVETATEMGYDITVQGWGGFAVPKDTPEDVIAILEENAETAINSDAMKELLESKGFEFAYLNGADMDAACAVELAHYQELIPTMNIE